MNNFYVCNVKDDINYIAKWNPKVPVFGLAINNSWHGSMIVECLKLLLKSFCGNSVVQIASALLNQRKN